MGILNWLFGAESFRGLDNEDDMTEDDWKKRGTEQAQAMLQGNDPFMSSPDERGRATGGVYNGDYSQETQDHYNRKLEEDEYYEAQTEQNLREISRLKEEQ